MYGIVGCDMYETVKIAEMYGTVCDCDVRMGKICKYRICVHTEHTFEILTREIPCPCGWRLPSLDVLSPLCLGESTDDRVVTSDMIRDRTCGVHTEHPHAILVPKQPRKALNATLQLISSFESPNAGMHWSSHSARCHWPQANFLEETFIISYIII